LSLRTRKQPRNARFADIFSHMTGVPSYQFAYDPSWNDIPLLSSGFQVVL